MNHITLYDKRFGEKEHQVLEVYLNEEGDLVFEGYDIGEIVKEYWGDSDYEYYLTIKKEHVTAVLLWLIKECFENKRFANDSDFRNWLEEKGITSEFWSWV
jgi:hypothetical protein